MSGEVNQPAAPEAASGASRPDHVVLQYGHTGLPLELRGLNATVLRPTYTAGLDDERAGFMQAVRSPIGAPPIRDIVQPGEKVAIVIPDITRALPSDRLLPWLLEEISYVPRADCCIIVGTGTHRSNTRDELCQMVGIEMVETVPIVCHDARDYERMTRVGRSPFGYDVHYIKEYVAADRRILMGFIEPHFMAGFSGGYKAVFPGVSDLESILQYHGYANIAHPGSTWGVLDGNPTQEHIRAAGALVPVDFLINVTLNDAQDITEYFCGDVVAAHEVGCAHSKQSAMTRVEAPFPIVVTTNSGAPLDQNLYQAVKGMCGAATISEPGGLIVSAARCNDGFPDHGPFREQLFRYRSPEAACHAISQPGFAEQDQWQTQKLAQILQHHRIQLYSELPPDDVRKAHLEPVTCVRQALDEEVRRLGDDAVRIAIMPEGPLTIPYVD